MRAHYAMLGLIAGLSGCIESATGGAACPALSLETEEDVRAARACTEVDGNLEVRGATLERVSLPHLRKVHGSLISIGGRPLRELDLPALEEVGASKDDVLELGFDASHLERVALPALKQVHGSLGIAAAGALRELDLGALEHVEQHLGLVNLPALAALNIPDTVHVQGRVGFQILCQLPAAALPVVEDDETQFEEQRDIGCCTDDAVSCSELACMCP